MSKKKKILILSCMVLLLAVTAVLNFVFTGKSDKDKTVTTASYFTEYKSEHTQSINERILQLDSIIASAEDNSDAKKNALENKLRLTEIIEKELLLENLIKAKGYKNIVVMMGVDSDNVTVVVEDDNFDTDDAVSIYTVLLEEVQASPENVKIVPLS